MDPDFGSSLEEEFFRREDQRLVARLRELRETETARETLSQPRASATSRCSTSCWR
jgi:hypothetical protein